MSYEIQRQVANLEGYYPLLSKPRLTVVQQIEEFERQLQLGQRNWLADLVGQWPGDETDEEFEQLLRDLD